MTVRFDHCFYFFDHQAKEVLVPIPWDILTTCLISLSTFEDDDFGLFKAENLCCVEGAVPIFWATRLRIRKKPLQGRFTKRFSLIFLGRIKSIYLDAAAIDV